MAELADFWGGAGAVQIGTVVEPHLYDKLPDGHRLLMTNGNFLDEAEYPQLSNLLTKVPHSIEGETITRVTTQQIDWDASGQFQPVPGGTYYISRSWANGSPMASWRLVTGYNRASISSYGGNGANLAIMHDGSRALNAWVVSNTVYIRHTGSGTLPMSSWTQLVTNITNVNSILNVAYAPDGSIYIIVRDNTPTLIRTYRHAPGLTEVGGSSDTWVEIGSFTEPDGDLSAQVGWRGAAWSEDRSIVAVLMRRTATGDSKFRVWHSTDYGATWSQGEVLDNLSTSIHYASLSISPNGAYVGVYSSSVDSPAIFSIRLADGDVYRTDRNKSGTGTDSQKHMITDDGTLFRVRANIDDVNIDMTALARDGGVTLTTFPAWDGDTLDAQSDHDIYYFSNDRIYFADCDYPGTSYRMYYGFIDIERSPKLPIFNDKKVVADKEVP